MTWSRALQRPAGQAGGSDNVSATLAADRAFPAAVAELMFAATIASVADSLFDMIVETDNYLTFEVAFSAHDREEGFNDDIRFAMRESGPPTARILRSDQCSLLLTPSQAEGLAEALLQAAQESRATGNPERRTSRSGQRRGSALVPNRTPRARRA